MLSLASATSLSITEVSDEKLRDIAGVDDDRAQHRVKVIALDDWVLGRLVIDPAFT